MYHPHFSILIQQTVPCVINFLPLCVCVCVCLCLAQSVARDQASTPEGKISNKTRGSYDEQLTE